MLTGGTLLWLPVGLAVLSGSEVTANPASWAVWGEVGKVSGAPPVCPELGREAWVVTGPHVGPSLMEGL